MNKLLFGSAYYLEYMPYDRLKEDIHMMKDAKMNVARIAESTWSTLEPEDGVFDFYYVDRVLDILEEEGIKAIIGTPTYAVPAWLVKKDPNVMVRTKDGQALYGRRQIMDIMNPTFRFHAERVITKLISHTAKRNCVIGFQIDNETKHYGTASEEVQQMFKKYLEDKYKTIDEFNKAFYLAYWSNSINKWEDLPDMRGCINGGLASEFEKFQRELAADYLKWQSELVSKYKKDDQFVIHNFDFEWKKFGADIAQDGYSYGVQPDIDHYKSSKCVTLSGCDIYHPTQNKLTGVEIAFCGDEIRSLKQDNYLVAECQAQAFKYWTPYPGQLRLHAYSHLASGALGIMYWNWHSIHNGYETYWKGLLSHDFKSNPTYEEACVFGKEWEEAGKQKLAIKKYNKVALVVDNNTLTSFKWFPIDKDLTYNDVVRFMYDTLYEMNVECDIVHVENLDINKYKMIVTPAIYSISEENILKLKEFVKSGGVLISSFKSFVADENLSVYHKEQPHLLTDCFGMSYNQFTEPERMKLNEKDVTYFAELLKVTTGEALANYQHPYWNIYAGITRNEFEKGVAYYLGCFTEKEVLKSLYERALKDADLWDEVLDYNWPVIIRSGINEEGNKLHYVLHYSEEKREILCPYNKVCDILSGNIYKAGDVITLKDWDVVILEEGNF